MSRSFTHATARRGRVPLILGLVGPSGTGKTKSALRLADGMRRVDPRPTFVVDTEARRSQHYAGEHVFEHVELAPPHGPADYLDVLNYAVEAGAGRVVIDSMTHEHDGEGGVLQMHAAEWKRHNNDPRWQLSAWAAPKQARRALINRMVTSGVDLLLCFRAARKIKPAKPAPIELGFVPVGGYEFMFEMAAKFLLLPGARGVPTMRSNFQGEIDMIKLPGQFEALFERSPQLSEDIGEQLARWAVGGSVSTETEARPLTLPELLTRLGGCSDRDALDVLVDEARAAYPAAVDKDRRRLKSAIDAATQRVTMLAAQAAAAARAIAKDGDAEDAGDGGIESTPPLGQAT